MNQLILTIALLISSSAFANFTGEWSGTGNLNAGTTPVTCEQMDLKIIQTETTIQAEGYFACPTYNLFWKPAKMDIQGENLLIAGKKVGVIQDSQLLFSIPQDYAIEEYTLQLTSNGGIYFERNIFTKETKSLYSTLSSMMRHK